MAGRAYNVLRAHRDLLITLFLLMVPCQMPELRTAAALEWIPARLAPQKDNDAASRLFSELIHRSMNTWTTLANDYAHIFKHA